MAKGGTYEGLICKQLSLWWSMGQHDDWFWRAAGSGGRATARGRRGMTTTGHCGDIAACCWQAELLTKYITFEVKRGYNKTADMTDLLDRNGWPTDKHRKETILGMIEQAIAAADRAKTRHWALIHKRDGMQPLIYVPKLLSDVVSSNQIAGPFAGLTVPVNGEMVRIAVYRFANFLRDLRPEWFRQHVRAYLQPGVSRNGR